MIPFSVDVPMRRWPWANWAVLAVTLVVSLVGFKLLHDAPKGQLPDLVLQKGAHFRPYQLVTHALLHAGGWHLLGNLLFLFVFGNAIDAKLGHLRFLGLYLAFALVAGAAWLAAGRGPGVVGASGAIMGLCGMFLVLYPRNNVSVWFDELFPFASWVEEVSGVWVVLGFVAWDVVGVCFMRDEPVAFVAHLAGMAAGVGAAVALVSAGWAEPDGGEENLLQWLGYRPPTPRPHDPEVRAARR